MEPQETPQQTPQQPTPTPPAGQETKPPAPSTPTSGGNNQMGKWLMWGAVIVIVLIVIWILVA